MNIRKHWKKLLLTTTAFFWTSCTSENEAVFPTIGQDEPPAIHPEASSDSSQPKAPLPCVYRRPRLDRPYE